MKKFQILYVLLSAYFCSNAQVIITVAGTGSGGYGGDGGPATAALLYHNSGIFVDRANNLYIADIANHRVRKVDTSGIITTIAGNGSGGYSGDGGPATNAELNIPTAIAVDTFGVVYIADENNNRIRKIDTNGIITTIAGTISIGYSGDGGAATAAQINDPCDITLDNSGNLHIAEAGNYCIRMINSSGVISTVAGGSGSGFGGDGGPATAATLGRTRGVAIDSTYNLYIADADNYRIRMVNKAGNISTICGNGAMGYSGDGGPATAAQIGDAGSGPPWQSVFPDKYGNILIADHYNNRIRKISTAGIITTIAGTGTTGYSGDGGPATAAELHNPNYVFCTDSGDIYISDQVNNVVRKLTASTTATTVLSMANDGAYRFFPNPATDLLNISAVKNSYREYTIINNGGTTVASGKILTAQKSIDIKRIPEGLYYIKLMDGRNSLCGRFVKVQ